MTTDGKAPKVGRIKGVLHDGEQGLSNQPKTEIERSVYIMRSLMQYDNVDDPRRGSDGSLTFYLKGCHMFDFQYQIIKCIEYKINQPMVQEFIDTVREEGYPGGCLITSKTVAKSASRLSEDNKGIRLYDKQSLKVQVDALGLKGISKVLSNWSW